MKQLLKNFARFFYDQDYQKSLKWIESTSAVASIIHHHIWTAMRIPAGPLFICIDLCYGHWLSLVFFMAAALTDWFDGKVFWYRGKYNKIGWIDRYTENLKKKENKNLIEKIIISDDFGDLLDGTADKILIVCCAGYLGYLTRQHFYFSILITMLIMDPSGSVLIGILSKKGKISGSRAYKHLGAGKVKFTFQVLFVLMLFLVRDNPFPYQEIILNFTLIIATSLTFLSIFCKIKKSFCQKLWQSTS